jgi:NADPH:quinone reductase-like Zn-dependent oxidoreductase
MKAVRIFACGDTGVLKYGDYPMPEVGPADVLVRVLATSVSRWDVLYRGGTWRKTHREYPGRRMFALPMQLGRDAVGVVEAVGADVRQFTVGDRVVGLPHPENPNCPLAMRGFGNLSTGISYPGHSMFGGNAQYVARPEHYWMRLPEGVAPESAAAAMWSYATSHRILTDRLQGRPDDVVLVTGTSGGMGSALVDLARVMGVRVIGVTRSADKVEFLRGIGADHVVVGTGAAAVAEVKDITGGLGVDGAVEFTGNRALAKLCIAAMRPGGTLVTAGADWSGEPFPIMDQDFVRLELTIRGVRGSKLDDQRIVLELLGRGLIKPAIFAVMPLSAIARAHDLLEQSEVRGRIVLDPWKDT